jgi:ADP-ribose pyrophosphatase YjhB (NUDIX family)
MAIKKFWNWNKDKQNAIVSTVDPAPIADSIAVEPPVETALATVGVSPEQSAEVKRLFADLTAEIQRAEESGRDAHQLRQAFAYLTNDPLRFQTPHDPRFRPYTPLSVDALRIIARSVDVSADCIAYIKREVTKVPLAVVPRDSADTSKATLKAKEEAEEWMSESGGLGGYGIERSVFEGQIIDDLLIVGAAAILYEFETVGEMHDNSPSQVRAIDGGTIRPLVTAQGFPIGYDGEAFEQWIQGVPCARFTRDELAYISLPSFSRTDSVYPMSPTENAALQLYTLMKIDEWNRTWLTDGSGYRRWMKLNPDVTPEQASAWIDIINLQTQGIAAERQKMGVLPGEMTGEESRKDQDFEGFEHTRINRICKSYGVNPASVGQHSQQYKDSQDAAMDSSREGPVAEILTLRELLYNALLKRKGWGCLKVTEDIPAPNETPTEKAARLKTLIESGQITVNGALSEYDLDPVDGGDQILVSSTVIPLSRLLAAPAPGETPPGDEPTGDDDKGGGPDDDKPGGGTPTPKGGKEVSRAEESTVEFEPSRLDRTPLPEPSGSLADEIAETKHTYSCAMLVLDDGSAERARAFASALIDPAHLAGDGLVKESHVTVLYGLETDVAAELAALIDSANIGPITVEILGVSIFGDSVQNDGTTYDVVKLDVAPSGELLRLRELLKQLPYHETFGDFKPHITLAYVKPGAGADYLANVCSLTGTVLSFDALSFSNRYDEQTSIALKSGDAQAVARALGQWERKALNRVARGQSPVCEFDSDVLDDEMCSNVLSRLEGATGKESIRAAFAVCRVLDANGHSHGKDGKFDGGLGIAGLSQAPQHHDITTVDAATGAKKNTQLTTHGDSVTPEQAVEWAEHIGIPDHAAKAIGDMVKGGQISDDHGLVDAIKKAAEPGHASINVVGPQPGPDATAPATPDPASGPAAHSFLIHEWLQPQKTGVWMSKKGTVSIPSYGDAVTPESAEDWAKHVGFPPQTVDAIKDAVSLGLITDDHQLAKALGDISKVVHVGGLTHKTAAKEILSGQPVDQVLATAQQAKEALQAATAIGMAGVTPPAPTPAAPPAPVVATPPTALPVATPEDWDAFAQHFGINGGLSTNANNAIVESAAAGEIEAKHVSPVLSVATQMALDEGKPYVNTGHVKKSIWMLKNGHLGTDGVNAKLPDPAGPAIVVPSGPAAASTLTSPKEWQKHVKSLGSGFPPVSSAVLDQAIKQGKVAPEEIEEVLNLATGYAQQTGWKAVKPQHLTKAIGSVAASKISAPPSSAVAPEDYVSFVQSVNVGISDVPPKIADIIQAHLNDGTLHPTQVGDVLTHMVAHALADNSTQIFPDHAHKAIGEVKNGLSPQVALPTAAPASPAVPPVLSPAVVSPPAAPAAAGAPTAVAPAAAPGSTVLDPHAVAAGTPALKTVGKLDDAHFQSIPDKTLSEPALPPLKPGQKRATGIIVVEPDGKVWIYEPKGHYAGYEHTFSKGGHEDGLTLQQNAHKELYEELGLTANILSCLGDFETSGTNTRYYIGVRSGGDPKDAEKGLTQKSQETEKVKLVSFDEAGKLLNSPRDQKVLAALKAHLGEPAVAAAITPSGHVTVQGHKLDVDHSKPVSVTDVDDFKAQGIKFSTNGETSVKKAITDGTIKSHGHLVELMAMTQAASKAHGHTSVNNTGFQQAVKHAGVEAALDAAHQGDADAKAFSAHLEAHSYHSLLAQAEAAKAAKAQADAARYQNQIPVFHAASPAEHKHKQIPLGKAVKKGYNDGALYEMPDGQQNYIKTPKKPEVAHNEHLANAIYKALGISAPESKVFTDGGKTQYASKLIPNRGELGDHGIDAHIAQDILKGFAADVLLGNHDVLGNGDRPLSNVVVGHGANGKTTAHRIDNGGAILFTGTGSKKPESVKKSLTEWTKFPTSNPNYAKVFAAAGHTRSEQVPGIGLQIKAVVSLRDSHGGWDKFIEQAAPGMPAAQRAQTAEILETRTKLLEDKLKSLPGANSLVGQRNFVYAPNSKQEHAIIAKQKGLQLTKDERDAVRTHKSSPVYNSGLLGNAALSASSQQKAQHLDSAIKKAGAIGVDSVLSRNLTLAPHEVAAFKLMQKGDIIAATPTHNSTSDTSGTFAGRNVQYCILAPAETPGIAARPITGLHAGETEIILPRGLSYRVVAVTEPGHPDAPETPQGWTWNSSAQVRLILEPIIPGVNDYEGHGKAHYTSEQSIKDKVTQGGVKIANALQPPNLSNLPDHIHNHLYHSP